ncbi:putative disease resistance protein rpp1 [Quercus suber]|uniref:Disease resistance protein rpp1 n=1 Tax=Quercus suber TaxID=58331 RepID=A0AAW0JQA0_QUESU
MHDLLHDLSLYVGQNDYCLIENTHGTSNFEKARHVSILDHNLGVDAMRDFLHKLSNNLRTIIFSCKECTYDEHGCPRLLHFPEGIQRLTALHRLEFTYCESLTSLPRGMKHLTALEILGIWDCEKLILMEGDDYPTRLRRLTIGFLPKLVSLPQGLIPSASTLQFLAIYHCGNLAKLPQWPPNLSSLPKLDILNCPKLLSLPKKMDRCTVLKD